MGSRARRRPLAPSQPTLDDPALLTELAELADMGDVSGLTELADRLPEPLAGQVRQLAMNFDFDGLANLSASLQAEAWTWPSRRPGRSLTP